MDPIQERDGCLAPGDAVVLNGEHPGRVIQLEVQGRTITGQMVYLTGWGWGFRPDKSDDRPRDPYFARLDADMI